VDPKQHGFDESDGPTNNGGPDNVDEPHPEQLIGMTDRGCGFMTRQVAAGRPFYLQLSHYASRAGGAAAEAELDVAFGQLLQKIDELGIASNTFVLFTTDHGTPGRNPPFAGGKGTVSEGGLRVPFILRGPGIATGSCSHVRAIGVDIFPTIADLARVAGPRPSGIEGGSLAALLIAGGTGTVSRTREEFVVHFPHYDKDATGPASALWLGDWKLIRVYETGARHLLDIVRDPGERDDLAHAQPDRVRELDGRLTTYLEAVHAQMPTTNNVYDPTKPTTPKRGGKRKAAP
jgi:arylsulfatase A-like enzyme